ncbi:DUF6338 family protein [Burkholderia multivorans]|uniref:DUF6338 family protein n=1 Tax=Burkholderia multivorans TaxID=87883 RepID=UPI0005D7861F|nr:DUF6338 family protein [Burkholderia multivorans]AJY18802.1 hypothetical protein NP80_1429 [Burkholderia multivorans ATCC BAA-247]MBU9498288.1 hypothetical protein [Burkholderia multivorans]MCO1435170.1 DUF6338 family protein [Burkholderia multivorans]MDN7513300.1 DUF6338 family protein [Burkholderia multivorans]UQN59441.1 DUF6338 family protein [Burkholderia multivorans]
MDITAPDKLLLVVLFVIPGFVAMKTYAILTSGPRLDASKAIIDAVAFSRCNYAVFALPIYAMYRGAWATLHAVAYALVWGCILLVGPVLCALGVFALRRSKWLARWLPHPVDRAWDYVFGQREPFYLIITLTSGKRIGATYGPNSFASSYPADPEIYVEEAWDVDDAEGFIRRHVQTRGLLISGSIIESIEFIGPYNGNEQRNDETNQCAGNCERRVPADT